MALGAPSVLYPPLYAHPLSSQEFPRGWKGGWGGVHGGPVRGPEFWHHPEVLGPSQQTLESLLFSLHGAAPAALSLLSRASAPVCVSLWPLLYGQLADPSRPLSCPEGDPRGFQGDHPGQCLRTLSSETELHPYPAPQLFFDPSPPKQRSPPRAGS